VSSITKYLTNSDNGLLEHHFWLDLSTLEEHEELRNWIDHNLELGEFSYWPELVSTGPATSTMSFHVILRKDRAAKLFRLRW